MRTTIKLHLKDSSARNGLGVLHLSITYKRKTSTRTTTIRLRKREWNGQLQEVHISPQISFSRQSELKYIRQQVIEVFRTAQMAAEQTLQSGSEQSAIAIIKRFEELQGHKGLIEYMRNRIQRLVASNRFETAHISQNALNSFLKFRSGEDIYFSDLSASLFVNYEQYLRRAGCSLNTISVYMRTLRATYNEAARRGYVETTQYTLFQQVFTGVDATPKKAISEAELSKIFSQSLPDDRQHLQLTKDLFLFSFFTRGMPFVDIAHLRKTDIQKETIAYRRQKTNQKIEIQIIPCIRDIIDRYLEDSSPDSLFVFPILASGATSRENWRIYRSALTRYNRHLKQLADVFQIIPNLTGYSARHSWASIANQQGVPIAVVSKGMGHTSERTTHIYINRLDYSDVHSANDRIAKLVHFESLEY